MPNGGSRPNCVGPAGTFRLSTYERDDGIPPGEYTATVVWFRGESDNLLPAAYGKPETSPLKIKVTESPMISVGQTTLKTFALKR